MRDQLKIDAEKGSNRLKSACARTLEDPFDLQNVVRQMQSQANVLTLPTIENLTHTQLSFIQAFSDDNAARLEGS